MTCERCGGFLIETKAYDEEATIWLWRCLNCGDRLTTPSDFVGRCHISQSHGSLDPILDIRLVLIPTVCPLCQDCALSVRLSVRPGRDGKIQSQSSKGCDCWANDIDCGMTMRQSINDFSRAA